MNEKKKLIKQLNQEIDKVVPDVKADVYKKIGISDFKFEKDAKLEKALKNEGNKFVPNDKERIYALLEIEHSNKNIGDIFTSAKVKAEKNSFVPNVKSKVFNQLEIKEKKPFFTRTRLAAISTSFLAVCILGAASIYAMRLIGDSNTNNTSTSTSTSDDETVVPLPNSLALMKVGIASSTIEAGKVDPEYSCGVTEKGVIDASNLIKNETAEYISTIYSINEENAKPNEYLLEMLNGSLNQNYISCSNKNGVGKVKISISTPDNEYFMNMKDALDNMLYEFVHTNYVYLEYEIKNDTELTESLSNYLSSHTLSDTEKQKVAYLSNLYDCIKEISSKDGKNILNNVTFSQFVDKYIIVSLTNLQRLGTQIESIIHQYFPKEIEIELITNLINEFEINISEIINFDANKYSEAIKKFKKRLSELIGEEESFIGDSFFNEYKVDFHKEIYPIDMSEEEMELIHDDWQGEDNLINTIAYFTQVKNGTPDYNILFDKLFSEFEEEKDDHSPDENNKDHHDHGDGRDHGENENWEEDFDNWFDNNYGHH